MNARLVITTLGTWSVALDGMPLPPLHSRKADALLAYLACERRPHQRTALADLLWEDIPTERGLANLSVLLTSLRARLAPFLSITRRQVAFVPHVDSRIDVVELEAALDAAALLRDPNRPTDRRLVAALETALHYYRGEFLHGLYVRGAGRFEEWQRAEQERLRGRMLGAGVILLDQQLHLGAYQAGVEAAALLLRLDPYHEEINRLLLLHYAGGGQRAAAIEHYRRYARLLADELGAAPPPALTDLYAQFQTGSLVAAGIAPAPRSISPAPSVPLPAASLVEREAELRQIAERLSSPACRLLTLLGPGGSGKTRLALQSATDLAPAYADGAVVVDLTSLADAALLPATIAAGLGLVLASEQAAAEQLIAHLSMRRILLVLDNFEHLLDGADLVARLLRAAPGLTVLTTSRMPLDLAAEWLLDVGGLALPPEDAPPDTLAQYGAARLFAQRALQVQPRFVLDATTGPAVAAICRAVDGLPLAIELAAAQLRSQSCAEVAATITQGFDTLTTRLRDVPARHRSMRAVFDASWALLTPAEREVLRDLAVFRGGFDQEAAVAVAAAAPEMLEALRRASLLRCSAGGEYSLHELVRQYAAEALAAAPVAEAQRRSRHAGYYAALVQRHEAALHQHDDARLRLAAALDNIRSAWVWASKHPGAELLAAMAPGLSRAYARLGLHEEGERSFRQVSARLWVAVAGNPAPNLLLLRAALVVLYGHVALLIEQARYREARQGLDLAPGWLAQVADPALHAHYALLRGQAFHPIDDCQRIAALLPAAVEQARAQNLPAIEAEGLRSLGSALWFAGRVPEAWAACEQALVLYRCLGDRIGEGRVLLSMGQIAIEAGQFAQARAYHEQSLRLCRPFKDAAWEAGVLMELAALAYDEGSYVLAGEQYAQAARACELIGHRRGAALAELNLGYVYRDTGDAARATACLHRALAWAEAYGDPSIKRWGLVGLGIVSRDIGDYVAAGRWFDRARAELIEGDEYKVAAWLNAHQCLLDRLRGALPAALEAGERALAAARRTNDRSSQGLALLALGHALSDTGMLERAAACYAEAAALRTQLDQRHLLCEIWAAQARLADLRSDRPAALALVERVLGFLEGGALDGVEEPARVYLTCSELLAAVEDARSGPLRSAVVALLHRRAAMLPADADRSVFLGIDVARTSPPAQPRVMVHGEALTVRETEVLELVALGMSTKAIAERLVVSVHTVQSHVKAIFQKLGVTSRAAATRTAIEYGLVSLEQ